MLWLSMHLAAAAPTALAAGFFGGYATHPGAFVAVARTVAHQGVHDGFVRGWLAGHLHRRRHFSTVLRPEVGYRLTSPVGPYLEAAAGLGLHHTRLAGRVLGEDGQAVGDVGRFSIGPAVVLAAGFDLSARSSRPLRLFARLDTWTRTPVNRRWLPGVGVGLGLAWTFGP